jgi:LPS O-antigen subunit length determinant protein (WzzB/FepE family)
VLENTRRTKTNKKNDNKNKQDIKDKEDNMSELIGENTFLKLREEKSQLKSELEQVKIQRDIALRKLNKALQIAKDLRKLVENGTETK